MKKLLLIFFVFSIQASFGNILKVVFSNKIRKSIISFSHVSKKALGFSCLGLIAASVLSKKFMVQDLNVKYEFPKQNVLVGATNPTTFVGENVVKESDIKKDSKNNFLNLCNKVYDHRGKFLLAVGLCGALYLYFYNDKNEVVQIGELKELKNEMSSIHKTLAKINIHLLANNNSMLANECICEDERSYAILQNKGIVYFIQSGKIISFCQKSYYVGTRIGYFGTAVWSWRGIYTFVKKNMIGNRGEEPKAPESEVKGRNPAATTIPSA